MLAAYMGDTEMVNMLLKAGADANQQDSEVRAAIGLAVCGSVCECAHL
jgi:ankyrin repeat protein